MKKLLLAGFVLASITSYSQITVTAGGGAAAINAGLFGAGVTISGLTIDCPNNAYGTFTGSLGTSGMTAGGVVLTTGNAVGADGPNNTGSYSQNNGGGGDAVLNAAQPLGSGAAYLDRCALDFTLVPQCNTLSINFCFGSEEYLEFVSSNYNDGFGIFVTGPNPAGGTYNNYNMARLPSGQVVSIDNVNTGVNPAFYNINTAGIMQYDGYTDGLVATLDVTPCATYTFHITICDAGDRIYDSGVFLQFQGLYCSVPAFAGTTTSTPTTCGGNNGTASVNITSGTGPFTHSWTNAAGGVIGTGTSVTGLAPGTYTITSNDASPCTPALVQTVTIAGSTGPTVTPVAETCAGYNNGSVTINNAVGAGPYTVTINGPTTATVVEANTAAAVANFTNLPDGVYTYTVTGTGGCTNNGTFTIGAGPPCCSVTATGVNATCFGGLTGTVTANPTGLAGFSYSWNTTPVQITQTASGLAAGTYTVTMTDASGCTATANVTITQPTQVNGTTVNVNPSCNGGTNGSITVNASGGTPGYMYSINGGAFGASNVFSGLAAGTHTIVIRDANNCTRTLTVTLTNPPLLTLNLTGTTPATCGVNNGTITVAGAGGTPGYTYSLSPGGPFGASATFSSLAAGPYTIYVHDANNCTATVNATITNSAAPVASILSQTNLTCAGGSNGSVLIGSSGSAPFTYSIDLAGATPPTPFQASNSFTGLIAGTYTATVQDGNGCTGTVNFTITAPTAVTFTSTPTPASCNGVCNGQIQVNPSGGTAPYTFSSNGGMSFSTANPITGLCAGTVNVVVKDANGCLANALVTITQPAALNATYTLTNPLCPNVCNGQIVVSTTTGGTTPYQYSVNGGALGASNTLTGLCNGPNTVLVQDANGCQLSSVQMLVDPPLFTITQTAMTESNCGFPNGSFEIVASGGFAPYNYHDVATGTNQPNGLYTNLSAGAYEIEVTDNNGCTQTFFAGINDIEMDGILDGMTDITCHGACDGTFLSHATGGIAPIIFELDGSGSFEMDGDFTGLCAGSHAVVMVDNGFCVFTLPFTLVEPDEIFFALTPANIACNGGATGSITVNSVTGGDGVYQYSLNGGAFQASNVFNGLTAGTYTITVQDGNGCTGVSTTTITEAPPINLTFTVQDLTCFGNNTGFLLIAASGGSGGFDFTPNYPATPFGAAFSFPSMAAGTYNIAVEDAAGCIETATAVINQPAPLAAAYVLSPALCNGSCDGSITVNASGGTTPYFYSSDNGITYQPTNNLQNLCAGSYQVMVKDSAGCLVGSSMGIIEPSAIVYSTAVTDATCGNNNGAINFNPASGGTPGYLYSTDGGATLVPGTSFTNLAPGSYDLTVEDANGCQVDATVAIANEASPVINAVFTTDPLCFNDCNGTADISASGGTGTLQYAIDGGAPQVSNIITGICSGAHVLSVTDANGCTDTHNINLINPAPVALTGAPAVTPLTCYQNSTGAISVSATGGTGTYTYSFDGGGTFGASNTLSNIAAGTYNLEIQDANGCTITSTAVVTEPNELVFASVNSTDATCNGVCDGTVDVSISGGTAPRTFSWGGGIAGASDSSAANVCVGTYIIIVEDANGCIINTTVNIAEPPAVVINGVTVTNALCNGNANGSVNINAPTGAQYSAVPTGNAPVYGASNIIGGLAAGTYDISVLDGAGCPATTTATVTEPDPLTMINTEDATVCYNREMDLFAVASGGTAPYTYTWSNDPTFTGSAQTVTPTAPMTVDVSVTDANGCTFGPLTTSIDVIPQLTGTVSNDTIVCAGSPVVLEGEGAAGLAPYQYFWTATPTFVGDVYNVTPTAPTTYTVTIVDVCSDSVVLNVFVDFYTAPNMTITPSVPAGCSPLSVSFNASFGGGFTSTGCVWDFGNGDTSMSCTVANTVYTSAGCYDVNLTVTSQEGCVFDSTFSQVACVYPDPVVDFTYNPTGVNILQPVAGFVNLTPNTVAWTWDFAGTDSSNLEHPTYDWNDFEAGEYMVCLEAVSDQGCTGDTCKPFVLNDQYLIYVPNAFTPDGDGVNDIFLPSVKGVDAEGYELMIFDRWGELIFQTTSKLQGWDGTFKGLPVKEDVYVWKIKAKLAVNDNVEDTEELNGHVTLIK